MYMQCCCTV